jgi:hypothetical protein
MSRTGSSEIDPSDLSSIGWRGRLDEATTAHEVVSVARDFVAAWTPEEMASLAPHCRPWKIVDADDVTTYAIQLAQENRAAGSDADPGIHKMGNFFSDASLRLSQILAGRGDTSH